MISNLEKAQAQELEDFLALVFGEGNRSDAKRDISSMFNAEDSSKLSFFVYRTANKIVGAAAISKARFNNDTWGISWVATHHDFRHQNIASSLVKHCVVEVSKIVKKLSTVVLASDHKAVLLYEKLGFRGSTKDHEDGVFLTLFVEPSNV